MKNRKSTYAKFIKPIADWMVAFVLMVILMPILMLIIIVNLILGHKVFFYHKRPGYHARLFNLIKFSTINSVDGSIDNFGKFLRSTSLDELPQLINILKGEMSFIGPRPLLINYMDKYSEEQKNRHFVKPGITGWAQVNGRNRIDFNKKMELDLFYVENISFKLDIKIILKTGHQLLKYSEADAHNPIENVHS